eukprot:2126475-Amphidinium_carterae.1
MPLNVLKSSECLGKRSSELSLSSELLIQEAALPSTTHSHSPLRLKLFLQGLVQVIHMHIYEAAFP